MEGDEIEHKQTEETASFKFSKGAEGMGSVANREVLTPQTFVFADKHNNWRRPQQLSTNQ